MAGKVPCPPTSPSLCCELQPQLSRPKHFLRAQDSMSRSAGALHPRGTHPGAAWPQPRAVRGQHGDTGTSVPDTCQFLPKTIQRTLGSREREWEKGNWQKGKHDPGLKTPIKIKLNPNAQTHVRFFMSSIEVALRTSHWNYVQEDFLKKQTAHTTDLTAPLKGLI